MARNRWQLWWRLEYGAIYSVYVGKQWTPGTQYDNALKAKKTGAYNAPVNCCQTMYAVGTCLTLAPCPLVW